MTLSSDEDAILHREVRSAAPIGGTSSSAVSRLFKPNEAEREVSLEASLDRAVEYARELLSYTGKLYDDELQPDNIHMLRAAVAAGKLNMSPVVVTLNFRSSDKKTILHIRGASREGLIKQRAGAEAVERIITQLARTE